MSKSLKGRQWFRHRATGDLGYLTTNEDGETCIRLDRGSHVVLRRFSPGDWLQEDEVRLMTKMQAAQVAFAADAELNKILRWNVGSTPLDWMGLRPDEKIGFRDNGPKGPIRRNLWKAIIDALEKECRE